jgi:predicted AlkP superfamily pyrophosphatase or phosphodiesterase
VRSRLASLTLVAALALPGGAATAIPEAAAPAARVEPGARVLAISVDGLNPTAIRRLGTERAPVLNRLVAEGAATLNARTAREMTVTLPNHTTMVTGRRIDAARGGHGVDWNDDLRGRTVQAAAGEPVASVFTAVADGGGESSVFAGKSKFSLFKRSWPAAVDRLTIDEQPARLVRAARAELVNDDRELTFLHLALPDAAGHDRGFMSPAYLHAVARTDRLIGLMVRAIEKHADLASEVTVVLTADHGGRGPSHGDATKPFNYRIPFLAWGADVETGDLYAMNPQRANPRGVRTTYAAARQPVRNGDLANLVTTLLGLPAVAGSEFGVTQDLRVSVAASPARG